MIKFVSSFLQIINFYLSLRKKFKNKNCFVLGSAPHGNVKEYKEDMLLIACNSSAKLASILGLKDIAMTVVDAEILSNVDKPSRTLINKNKLLKGLDLGYLIQSQSNNTKLGHAEILDAKFKKLLNINNFARSLIIKITTRKFSMYSNSDSLISTGAFTILLCFFLGAKSVTFSGFSLYQSSAASLSPDYFYKEHLNLEVVEGSKNQHSSKNENNFTPRNHSAADVSVISLLYYRFKFLYSSDNDFLPILNQWGYKK
jgi:hypothetical protein